jgi:hypothetical protein
MTSEEIYQECKSLYESNKANIKRLEELRELCTHEKTEVINYGCCTMKARPTKVCIYCMKPIPTNENTL